MNQRDWRRNKRESSERLLRRAYQDEYYKRCMRHTPDRTSLRGMFPPDTATGRSACRQRAKRHCERTGPDSEIPRCCRPELQAKLEQTACSFVLVAIAGVPEKACFRQHLWV